MRSVEGWLGDDQALLLVRCADRALPGAVVEVGSAYGRSTVVLGMVAKRHRKSITAIDPHQGDLGPAAPRIEPTWDRFLSSLKAAGVEKHVNPVRKPSHEVEWEDPISLLFIDGQHDYTSVERDFRHFEPHLKSDAVVVFRGYTSVVPEWGVQELVYELRFQEDWKVVGRAPDMIAITK